MPQKRKAPIGKTGTLDSNLLLRGAVHNLNNSVASIMGYADFLLDDLDGGSDSHLFAASIKRAGAQMQTLLQHIRTLNLVHEGAPPPPLLSLEKEVKNVCDGLRPHLPPSVTLNLKTTKTLAQTTCRIHPHHLHILMLNIVGNALESTAIDDGAKPSRALTLSLTATVPKPRWPTAKTSCRQIFLPVSTGKKNIFLTWDDNGQGIAKEDIEKICDPFFTTKSADHTHGMGLTVVREILTRYGGGLIIESCIGKGTRVSLSLPIEN